MAKPWQRTPWVGVNFWSRSGGPRMWVRYDGGVVREELTVLAANGCNITRSFCYWPDFVPEVERLDEEVLERFSDFLDAHVEKGVLDNPHFYRGPHVGGELGPELAAGQGPVQGCLDGVPTGLVRRSS